MFYRMYLPIFMTCLCLAYCAKINTQVIILVANYVINVKHNINILLVLLLKFEMNKYNLILRNST